MPYTALQSVLDASAPAGLQNYWKSHYLGGLDDDVIDTIVTHAGRMTSPLSAVQIHHLGGAVSRVGEDETAFSHRDAPYAFSVVSAWPDPQDAHRHIAWTRAFSAVMEPFSQGGVYMNFLGDEGDERVRAAYGAATYDRLVDLKTTYDPTNLFCLNQNIRPRT
jgi:FAD/FMN-containing dehydrogenase